MRWNSLLHKSGKNVFHACVRQNNCPRLDLPLCHGLITPSKPCTSLTRSRIYSINGNNLDTIIGRYPSRSCRWQRHAQLLAVFIATITVFLSIRITFGCHSRAQQNIGRTADSVGRRRIYELGTFCWLIGVGIDSCMRHHRHRHNCAH